MKTITIDDVLALKPCKEYTRKQLEKIAGWKRLLKKRWSAEDILKTKIPHEHKIWVILHAEFMDRKKMVSFAVDCVKHVENSRENKYPMETAQAAAAQAAAWAAVAEAATTVEAWSTAKAAAEAAAKAADAVEALAAWTKAAQAVAEEAETAAAWARWTAVGTTTEDTTRAVWSAVIWAIESVKGKNKEQAWQKKRLVRYLKRGEKK